MSNTKHTPGPWDVFEYENGMLEGCSIIGHDGGKQLTFMATPNDGEDSEVLANMRLAAASPDLLEALRVYLMAGHKEARRDASVQAKAAILKATGEVV